MTPTYANLLKYRFERLAVVNLLAPNVGNVGMVELRSRVQLTDVDGALTLAEGAGDPPGMWVHYRASHAAYGLAEAGETWAASGPFSGCQIVVGSNAGRVYVAHLAQESGSAADTEWRGRGWLDETWGRWKVPLPSEAFFSNSIVFVDWAKGSRPRDISVVRVDVRTEHMGGFDPDPMEIFDVVQVVEPE